MASNVATYDGANDLLNNMQTSMGASTYKGPVSDLARDIWAQKKLNYDSAAQLARDKLNWDMHKWGVEQAQNRDLATAAGVAALPKSSSVSGLNDSSAYGKSSLGSDSSGGTTSYTNPNTAENAGYRAAENDAQTDQEEEDKSSPRIDSSADFGSGSSYGSNSGTGSSYSTDAYDYRAKGGPVQAGRHYVVAEKGPEAYVQNDGDVYPLHRMQGLTPSEDGVIIPNDKLRALVRSQLGGK